MMQDFAGFEVTHLINFTPPKIHYWVCIEEYKDQDMPVFIFPYMGGGCSEKNSRA